MKLIVANWKMHGSADVLRNWTAEIAASANALASAAEAVLCPPAVFLNTFQTLPHGPIILGAQDCHAQSQGAYTGDVSATMLKEAGCAYVIVGHSERRAAYGETDALVAKKATAALQAGITPILCVGESEAQRAGGKAEAIVSAQLSASLQGVDAARCFVAYEPIWAIGSGRTPTSAEITSMHATLAQQLGNKTRVLYGGSVKAENSGEIFRIPHVAGALVGGASLDAAQFNAILRSATQ